MHNLPAPLLNTDRPAQPSAGGAGAGAPGRGGSGGREGKRGEENRNPGGVHGGARRGGDRGSPRSGQGRAGLGPPAGARRWPRASPFPSAAPVLGSARPGSVCSGTAPRAGAGSPTCAGQPGARRGGQRGGGWVGATDPAAPGGPPVLPPPHCPPVLGSPGCTHPGRAPGPVPWDAGPDPRGMGGPQPVTRSGGDGTLRILYFVHTERASAAGRAAAAGGCGGLQVHPMPAPRPPHPVHLREPRGRCRGGNAATPAPRQPCPSLPLLWARPPWRGDKVHKRGSAGGGGSRVG